MDTRKNKVPFCTMCEFRYSCMRFLDPTPKLIYCKKNKCYYEIKNLNRKNINDKKRERQKKDG